MANSYIDFTCKQQDLTLTDPPVVAEGASVLYARFDLCPKWDGLALYARFKHLAAVYDVPITDGCALIPWEVVKYTGFEVSIFGEDAEGGRLTSAKLFVEVKRSIDFDGAPPIQATQTLIQVFEGKVQSCIDIAAGVRADADAGKFNGDPFTVSKIYASVAEMEADESGSVAVGQFVMINAGTVNDEDNAKLYQRTESGWRFIVDISGASGTLEGLSSTGTAGQVLTRTADGFAWADAPDGLPDGGSAGQVLTRTADGAEWQEAADPVSYPITVEQGGTGAETAAAARENLGAAAAEHEHNAADITSGLLPIAYGGTGANTAAGALANLGVSDYIVEQGTSGIWTYRKWASGAAECYGSQWVGPADATKTWGSWYYHDAQAIDSYPFAFAAIPCITAFKENGAEGLLLASEAGSTTTPPKVYIVRPTTYNAAEYRVHVSAKGRWK